MTGLRLSPDDAYLIMRGLRTLDVRLDKHQENTNKIAKFLSQKKNIEVLLGNNLIKGTAIDIKENGSLILRTKSETKAPKQANTWTLTGSWGANEYTKGSGPAWGQFEHAPSRKPTLYSIAGNNGYSSATPDGPLR